jgi:hypothetical protein
MAPSKSPLMRLGHIRDEIASLLPLFNNVDYAAFCRSYMLLRVTERAILIIAEAAKALPDELTARYPGGGMACNSRHWQYPAPRVRAGRNASPVASGYPQFA